MTAHPLLTVALVEEADIIAARQRAREIAGLVGFQGQDQARIATAVSEIARNATTYGGGGRVHFSVRTDEEPTLEILVRDSGSGIKDLDAILEGRFKSVSGMGVGLAGARRLMDTFRIVSQPGVGTEVTLGKRVPRSRAADLRGRLGEIGKALASSSGADPLTEARLQNLDLLQALSELSAKREESERLNSELENTNRGVVALYAELDEKAAELTALNGDLERRVAAAVRECQLANDALRQSQKMEAIGQLTGGVAHDFNNLLHVVLGNLELLMKRLPPDDPRLLRSAVNAMQGAQRAATLTQRLLAFSRRQPLAPKPINPNHLVEGMLDLLRRTIGEMITVTMSLPADLWQVEVDAHQLENAILNLAVNARDAMGSGGTLSIVTANGVIGEGDAQDDSIPGHYVSLAVSDTGSGMSDEILSRVLEPFFTTKEVGKGTGLGLSMVYGFVKQSGGHLRIESAIGRGTTVTLYMPRYTGADASTEKLAESGEIQGAKPGEVILVIEDDPDVRDHTCELLKELGYAFHAVSDGPAAIAAVASEMRLDLLFSDVVLAGAQNGREAAREAHQLRPDLPILFTSGYAHDVMIETAGLNHDSPLLPKPFTLQELSVSIRALIDRS